MREIHNVTVGSYRRGHGVRITFSNTSRSVEVVAAAMLMLVRLPWLHNLTCHDGSTNSCTIKIMVLYDKNDDHPKVEEKSYLSRWMTVVPVRGWLFRGWHQKCGPEAPVH